MAAIKVISIEDVWPGGVSNGLELSCSLCGKKVVFDYHVSDEFWDSVIPQNIRRDVVCLSCLDKAATVMGLSIIEHLEAVQFTGEGKTIVLIPQEVYVYAGGKWDAAWSAAWAAGQEAQDA